MSTDEAKILLIRARLLAKEGRRLIDTSIAVRREALHWLPVGAVLDFPDPHNKWCSLFAIRLRPDGAWVSISNDDGDRTIAKQEWVEEQWTRGNLKIREEGEA
jgi:hypothetical protein